MGAVVKMCKEKIKKMMPAGKPAGISLHEKFIILYVYTKNTGKSGNTKRKELKKMNNGYEHMEEKTQDGVCFQWDESHEDILDMNVEAGIKVVALPSSVRMSKTEKMFPDVEELVIANNVKNILIPNTLFPNVKKVTEGQSWMLPDLSVPRKTTNGPI